jgi:pyruvate,water dikinase
VITPLADARDGDVFGGKAVQLGAAIRSGLPVPPGYALSPEAVEAVVGGQTGAVGAVQRMSAELGLLAVRSSSLDEDSADASFAGAHLSVLAVSGPDATVSAVGAVHASGTQPGAQGYRQRLGLTASSRMAVVVQRLVDADAAGVMFTRNPVSGADERVIEAGWGLGEAVVAGLITPDHYRVARGGRELERTLGDKDVALRPAPHVDGGPSIQEVALEPDLVASYCLAATELAALDALATRCDEVYGATDHDIEFAVRGGEVFLLQRRPITRA